MGPCLKGKHHDFIINLSLYGDSVEIIKHKNILPKGENIPDIWTERQYTKTRSNSCKQDEKIQVGKLVFLETN